MIILVGIAQLGTKDIIAHLEVAHLVANGNNLTAGLVAQNAGIRIKALEMAFDHLGIRSVADAAGNHLHNRIIGAHFRFRNVIYELKLAQLRNNQTLHFASCLSFSLISKSRHAASMMRKQDWPLGEERV